MSRFLLLSLAVLPGCMDYGNARLERVDTFDQNAADELDLLLVIDDSASMQLYQARLGANFDTLISWFIDGNVDWRIAVTTTDDGNDPTVVDPARGRFVGPVITADTENPDQAFREEVAVGTSGSGFEVGLKTALLALTDDRLADQIAGFLRDDASLSLVFVSDEDDSSPLPVNDYVNAFFDLKGQRDRDRFNASALTVTDPALCSAEGATFSRPGPRYVDVATQTDGLSANLCESDFRHIVGDLSLAASRLRDRFLLTAEPDASSLDVKVTVDGEETDIPCGTEWTYQRVLYGGEDVPAVVFAPGRLPPPGSQVAIGYTLGSGELDPAACGGP